METEGLFVDQQGGLWPESGPACKNHCGIIAPSLCRTGGHSFHARRAGGRSSVIDEEEGSVSFSVCRDRL